MAAEEATGTFAAQIIVIPALPEKAEGYLCAEKSHTEKVVDTTAPYCDSANLSPHYLLVLLHDHFPHHRPKMLVEPAQADVLWVVV